MLPALPRRWARRPGQWSISGEVARGRAPGRSSLRGVALRRGSAATMEADGGQVEEKAMEPEEVDGALVGGSEGAAGSSRQ